MAMRSPFVAMLLLAAIPAIASAQTSNAAVPLSQPTNAALVYWQAFAMMPEASESEKALFKALGAPTARESLSIDKDAATPFIEKFAPALQMLNLALRIPECDWELDYRLGAGVPFFHLNKALTAAKALALRARLHIAHGNPAEAIKDIQSALTMSRHIVGRDRLVVPALVQISMERLLFQALASDLSKYDHPSLEALLKTLDMLPPRLTVRDAITTDNKVMLDWLRLIAQASRESHTTREKASKLLNETAKSFIATIKTPEQVNEAIAAFEKDTVHLASLLTLPSPEADAKSDAFCREATARQRQSPFSALILPAFVGLPGKEEEAEARLAMLRTAVDIFRHKNAEEPPSYGSFDYKTLKDGFELTTRTPIGGKPVSMIFR